MAKNKLTPAQIEKSLANERLRLFVFAIPAFFGSAAVFVLALTPLAKAVAGAETDFNLNISLAINLGLFILAAAVSAVAWQLNRRRVFYAERVSQLEQQLLANPGR